MNETWLTLEALFRESKQYRGDNWVRLTDLKKMVEAIYEKGGITSSSGVHVQKSKAGTDVSLDPKGGLLVCQYQFDPQIWGKWFPSQDTALSMASMDKDVTSQYAGRSQGHTVHKRNWGGRVVDTPGKARSDYDRMPSAMDRYDVLMQGEVETYTKVNKRTGESTQAMRGILSRVAYSPSIGSSEERKARLLALIAGQSPSLSRRPQPHVPEPERRAAQKAIDTPAPSVPRVGQNLKTVGDDEEGQSPRSISGTAPSKFSAFLSKHNAEYEPQVNRQRNSDDDAQDALDALFPKGKK